MSNDVVIVFILYQSVAENTCGHTFCVECWSKYLKSKINDEGVGNIPCPAADCDIIVDDELVNGLVDDIETKDRYRYLTQKCFVQVSYSMLMRAVE